MPEGTSRLVYQWLLKRSAASQTRSVRAAELARRIVSELGLGVLEAREALRTLRAEGLVGYAPDLDGGPYTGYLTVVAIDAPPPPSLVRWREALAAEIGDLVLIDLLIPCHVAFSDLAADDLRRVARSLLQLPVLMNSASPSFGFSLSARGILGSSKLLGCIPEAARRHLGIASLPASPSTRPTPASRASSRRRLRQKQSGQSRARTYPPGGSTLHRWTGKGPRCRKFPNSTSHSDASPGGW